MRIVWVIFFLLTEKAFSQIAVGSLKARIDSMVLTKMQKTKAVGVAIGIVKNGHIYYNKGYGTKELNTSKSIDSLTNFHLASISKVFVATAIMQLVEQGKINLDAKLLDYISVSKLKDDRFKTITIKQMLIHMSGFPDVNDYRWDNPRNDSLALGNYSNKCIETKKLIFDPGTKFEYSNMAFEVLGYVIETITKKPFDTYEYDHVLSKARLNRSNFDYTKIDPSRRSSPHIKSLTKVKVSKTYPYNREHGPSSTLNSCTYDMCQWILEMLTIYEDKTNSYAGVLKHETLMDMWSVKYRPAGNQSIGLTWAIFEKTPLGFCVWHDGEDRGYGSLMLINPEQKFGIIMLINGDYASDKFFSGLAADISMLFIDK
jgi:CubicO group peptidase (beta-lactamase class C family)